MDTKDLQMSAIYVAVVVGFMIIAFVIGNANGKKNSRVVEVPKEVVVYKTATGEKNGPTYEYLQTRCSELQREVSAYIADRKLLTTILKDKGIPVPRMRGQEQTCNLIYTHIIRA